MFPSGSYFNLGNPVGPINMIDLHPYGKRTVNHRASRLAWPRGAFVGFLLA